MQRLNRRFAEEHKLAADNTTLPVRVLQFGEGNFLRAFIDWFIDILNEKTSFKGRVLLVQPLEQGLVPLHAEQDFLYTLFLRGIQNGERFNERRVISCIAGGVNPFLEYERYLQSARNPDMRFIFSNATEAGIVYVQSPDPRQTGVCSASFPAKLCAWLYERWEFFRGADDKGCIIMPCELIESNGAKLKEVIMRHAEDWNCGGGFTGWLSNACVFANTLVDRVVSGYPKEEAASLGGELGYEDKLLDAGEYFHLFVIEADSRYQSELPFHEAALNVVWTNDVRPYRERKVKILNGAHTSVSLAGYLAGCESVGEYAADPVLGKLLDKCLYEELAPDVSLPPDECRAFAAAVVERFKNPFIKHLCLSIALNSVSKYRVRVLPTLLSIIKKTGKVPDGLSFALAALIVFYHIQTRKDGACFGRTEDGREYPIMDDQAALDGFESYWKNHGGSSEELAKAVLGDRDFWGEDLNQAEGLTRAVAGHLSVIAASGITGAIKAFL